MRGLDCILEKSKEAELKAAETLPKGMDDATRDMIPPGQNIRVERQLARPTR